ncbi:hypothetical protein BU59_28850 [Escherichia coli O69:H11 str. 07-3763]|nr:hypothetical protein BU59_28850 [Escherichia coli O69:H11 str. 07-3763]
MHVWSNLDKAATPVEKIGDDVKTWTSDAWAWIGDHTLGALSLITDVVAGTVEQVKLLLVQGDLALAEFIQSAWETTKNVPGVGALFGELAEENRVFIEKTKRDELALRKIHCGTGCAYTPGGNGVHQPFGVQQASAKVRGSRKPSAVWLKS